MITCKTCNQSQPDNMYLKPGRPRKFGTPNMHVECSECRVTKRVTTREQRKVQYRASMRDLILEHYGAVCRCCGNTESSSLLLHNKSGDLGSYNTNTKLKDTLYKGIIDEGYPDVFELLCRSCSWHINQTGKCICKGYTPPA